MIAAIIEISGPCGCGKSTLAHSLMEQLELLNPVLVEDREPTTKELNEASRHKPLIITTILPKSYDVDTFPVWRLSLKLEG